jgi:hypothetical protein
MDTALTIIGIVVGILVPFVGWIFKTVVDLKACNEKNVAQHEAFNSSCSTCRYNFEGRLANNEKESDRRFSSIEKFMESITQKIDKLLSEGHR